MRPASTGCAPAAAYLLLNTRKHWRERHGASPPERLDAASSGRWFDGWRRHGLVDPAELPGS